MVTPGSISAPAIFGRVLLALCTLIYSAGCTCVSIPLVAGNRTLDETVVSGGGRNKVVLVDVSGVLSTREKRGLLPFRGEGSIVSRVREELEKAEGDERVKGLIVRINSPGGTITSSDIIYRELKRFKEKRHLPIVACMMEVATSGGYYVALAADSILAHPTTVTGSIGVIALKFNAAGLMEKIGIENETIMAGDKKDLFSPFRPITGEERAIVQTMLNDFHQRFKDVVAENRRGLSPEGIARLADGRVYTADQALEKGLIDQVGYLDDAVSLVKDKAGIDKARVVIYHRPYRYKNNIYSQTTVPDFETINLVNLNLSWLVDGMGLRFMYLWLP